MRSKHPESQKERLSYLDNAHTKMRNVSLKSPFSINEQTDNLYTLTKDDRNEIGLLSFPDCGDVFYNVFLSVTILMLIMLAFFNADKGFCFNASTQTKGYISLILSGLWNNESFLLQ